MKTVQCWLEEIKNPLIRSRALNNMFRLINEDTRLLMVYSLREALTYLDWRRTPEGLHYWYNMYELLEGIIPVGPGSEYYQP